MNCPYCGVEMKQGYVWKDRGSLSWSPTGPGVFRTPKGFIKLEAPGGDSAASQMMPTYPAYLCEACKKAIIDYE